MWSLAIAMWTGYRAHKLLPINVIVTDNLMELVEGGTRIGWL